MAVTRIIGDVHGDWYSYQMLVNPAVAGAAERSIQVGDMFIGIGGNDYWHEQINAFHAAHPNHRFIRGNHDHPERCRREMVGWIPDGTVEGDVMLVGGAFSIDWFMRVPGQNWWEDEELGIDELYRLIDLYAEVKPRVMITHDAPISVTEALFIKTGLAVRKKQARPVPTLTGYALETMFAIHQPDLWCFGHWHHSVEADVRGTHFHCLGICDWVDVDLSTGAYVGRPIR